MVSYWFGFDFTILIREPLLKKIFSSHLKVTFKGVVSVLHLSSSISVFKKRLKDQYFERYLPVTNRAGGPYWGILARDRDSTDRASRGPYKNDRGPIFPSTARAS